MKRIAQIIESGTGQVGGRVPRADCRRQSPPPGRCAVGVCLIVLAIYGLAFAPMAAGDAAGIERLTERLEQEPSRVDLRKQRADLLRMERRYDEALDDLDRARLLNPNDREIYLKRGLTLSGLRRDREAETELDAFLQQEGGSRQVIALAERGRIRARTGRPELAIADFTDAIAIKPALDLYLARGKLQESTGQLSAAAAGYQNGISRVGPATTLITALIKIQVQQGHFQLALAMINAEVVRAPIRTLWLLSRAEVLRAMGQTTEAQAELKTALGEANRALQKRPTSLHLLARAKVLRAMGRFDEAREDLQVCLKITPRFPECRELLSTL